jgi:hypothetical protein
MERAAATGGAPIPVVQLNTSLPTLGPYVMGEGQFTTTVYPGPFMHFSTHARLGAHVNTTA